jgi:hypothetical protein
MSVVGAPLRALTQETRGPNQADGGRTQGGLTFADGTYFPPEITTHIDMFHDSVWAGPAVMFTDDELRAAILKHIPASEWEMRRHDPRRGAVSLHHRDIYIGQIPIRFTNQPFRRGDFCSFIKVFLAYDGYVTIDFVNNLGEVCAGSVQSVVVSSYDEFVQNVVYAANWVKGSLRLPGVDVNREPDEDQEHFYSRCETELARRVMFPQYNLQQTPLRPPSFICEIFAVPLSRSNQVPAPRRLAATYHRDTRF